MRAPPAPRAPQPLPRQPSTQLSRAFTQQMPRGTTLGYKMNKQKPSTRIYSIPLPPPAPSRHESGFGVRRPPERPAKSRAPAGGDSPRRKYQHQGLLELCSQPRCTAGSPKGLLAVSWEDDPERRDIPMGHAGPPPGQAGISIPLGPGACSFALVQGVLLIIFS